jgi:molybdopterin-containing oxidoreductase family iron-sulfur binding subunit
MAMLIDLTRCVGCDACSIACKQENGTPVDTFFARVLNLEIGTYPNVKRVYVPVLCNHCEDAPCLKSCPNKAIIRREDGIVLIDQDRCRGTGACTSACPYGNIYLRTSDDWYLDEEEPYEKDFVKPRLNPGVARKCTYCAHRVDQGLDPACVVACPTTARIFGDVEDPDSKISRYIREQERETGRTPFHLLPEAKTRPAGMYLGTMAEQTSRTLGNRATAEGSLPLHSLTPEKPRVPAAVAHKMPFRLLRVLTGLLALLGPSLALAQAQMEPPPSLERFQTSVCSGCHGMTGNGGMGPPITAIKMKDQDFLKIVREGKGMMPGTPSGSLSDEDVAAIHAEVAAAKRDPNLIPIAFKVGQLLSTRNVALIFMVAGLFSLAFSIKVLVHWLRLSGLGAMAPHLKTFGYAKAAGVFLWSLVVDGFCVASLYRRNKHRWLMHGLMLYGFFGLFLVDLLQQVFNPTRADLPMSHPIKLLAVFSGGAMLVGVAYVMVRYKTDRYIDNGLTLGRDFLFVNLLLHTVFSGFLTVALNRFGVNDWLMAIYVYHLSAVALLITTAPFTRFAHAFVVPVLVAVTRVTQELTKSGLVLEFEREPSPGRHHKSQRIAEQVASIVSPESPTPVRLRYYP